MKMLWMKARITFPIGLLLLSVLASCSGPKSKSQVTLAPTRLAQATPTPSEAAPPPSAIPSEIAASETQALPSPTATASQPTSTESSPSSPTPAPSATPRPIPASREPKSCTDVAAYFGDITIPDNTLMRQGESFVKTWRVRNEGTCTWDENYSLVFYGGNNMNAPLENTIPRAAPGEIIDISLEMTAPARGGTYAGNWEFQDDLGQNFGVGKSGHGPIWAQIVVTFVSGEAPAPTPVTGSQPVPGACATTRDTAFEAQLLEIINTARAANGLPTLSAQAQLSAAALAHSSDMACAGYVDHIGSDGSLWYDRVAAQGYANSITARENIRVGFPDFGFSPQYVYDQWFVSQVHNENMFYPTVTEVGIGYVFSPGSEWGGYVTAVFARP